MPWMFLLFLFVPIYFLLGKMQPGRRKSTILVLSLKKMLYSVSFLEILGGSK